MDKETFPQIEQTAIKAEEIFKKLPLVYKRLITIPDWLMVLGSLKAATDYGFLGNTWDENEFSQFKKVLEQSGLKVSEVDVIFGKDNIPFRRGWIYNPKTLAEHTKNSKLAPEYDGKIAIESYVQSATEQGYESGGIFGKIYSFPESAILDYLSREKENEDRDKRVVFHQGNETYWVYPPVKNDVKEREEKKTAFFEELEKTSQFEKIMSSDELNQSNHEWRSRLPVYLSKHNEKAEGLTLIEKILKKVRNAIS